MYTGRVALESEDSLRADMRLRCPRRNGGMFMTGCWREPDYEIGGGIRGVRVAFESVEEDT